MSKNLPHQKSTFLFGPGEQILDKVETICSQQDKFGNDFVSETISERLTFPFLTLLLIEAKIRHQAGIGNTVNHGLRQCDLPWIGARTLIGPACSSLLQGGAAPPLHHVGDGAGEPPLALALCQQQLLSGPLLLNLRSDLGITSSQQNNRSEKIKIVNQPQGADPPPPTFLYARGGR